MNGPSFVGLFFLIVLTLGSTPARADEVVFWGDGWLVDTSTSLQNSFTQAGLPLTIDDQLVVSTASTAANPTPLLNQLALNPDVRWIVMSLGDVDFRRDFQTQTPANIRDANIRNLRRILETLFSEYPRVRVVFFGPDWGNWVDTVACQDERVNVFGPLATTAEINTGQREAVGEAYRTVANVYPNVDYIDFFGTLQPGAPDVNSPSPANLIAPDCIFPTSAGFQSLADRLVRDYWGAPIPIAEPVIVPSPTCVGQRTSFTSASTTAIDNTWRIDGIVTSTLAMYDATFSTEGIRIVELEAGNGANTATASVPLHVLPSCDAGDAGILDVGGFVDAGFVDAGIDDTGVDGGFQDTGVDAGVAADAAVGPSIFEEIEIIGACNDSRLPDGRPIYPMLLLGVALWLRRRPWRLAPDAPPARRGYRRKSACRGPRGSA